MTKWVILLSVLVNQLSFVQANDKQQLMKNAESLGTIVADVNNGTNCPQYKKVCAAMGFSAQMQAHTQTTADLMAKTAAAKAKGVYRNAAAGLTVQTQTESTLANVSGQQGTLFMSESSCAHVSSICGKMWVAQWKAKQLEVEENANKGIKEVQKAIPRIYATLDAWFANVGSKDYEQSDIPMVASIKSYCKVVGKMVIALYQDTKKAVKAAAADMSKPQVSEVESHQIAANMDQVTAKGMGTCTILPKEGCATVALGVRPKESPSSSVDRASEEYFVYRPSISPVKENFLDLFSLKGILDQYQIIDLVIPQAHASSGSGGSVQAQKNSLKEKMGRVVKKMAVAGFTELASIIAAKEVAGKVSEEVVTAFSEAGIYCFEADPNKFMTKSLQKGVVKLGTVGGTYALNKLSPTVAKHAGEATTKMITRLNFSAARAQKGGEIIRGLVNMKDTTSMRSALRYTGGRANLVGGRFLARRISLAAIRGYFWVGMVYEGLLGIYAILKSYEAGQLAKQMGYETLHEDLEKAEFELQKFGNYLDERFAQPAQEEIRSWDLGNTLAAGYQAEGDGGISNWSEEKKEKARAELAARQAAAQAKAEEQARIARVKANGGRVLKFMCIAEDTCTKAPRPECLDYVDDPYCHLSSIRKKDLELFNCNEKGSWDYLSCIIKRSFVEEALASPVPLREALMPPSVLSAMITSAEKMVVDAQNGRQRYNMQQIPVSDYAASTAEVVSDNRFEEKTRHEDQGGKIDSLLKQMKEQQKQMENQSYLNKSIFREMLRYPILEKVMSYLFPNTYASLKGDEYIIRFRHPMHCITEVRGRCVSSSKFFRRRDPKVMWRNPDPLYVDAVKLIGEIGDGLNRAKGIDKKTWGKIELLASKQKSLKKLSRKTEKDLNNYLIKNRKRPIDFRGNEARYGQRMQSTMSAEFKAFGIDDYFNSRGGSKRKYSPQSYQDDDDSSTQTRADGVSFGNVVPGDYEEEEGYTNANANKSGGQKSADGDGGNFAYEENLKIHDLGINKNTQISLFRLISIKYIKHFYLNK